MATKLAKTVGLKTSIYLRQCVNHSGICNDVIVARALPDVRDGLKPVQRRIL